MFPHESPDEPWTDVKNHRRAELVDREIAGTLTPIEVIELADLQRQLIQYVDRVAPRPIEEARELDRQPLEKARRNTRPDGVKASHFEQRKNGTLSETF